jgi:hypothetical protein
MISKVFCAFEEEKQKTAIIIRQDIFFIAFNWSQEVKDYAKKNKL